MKKAILRNIAILSAIFIVTFSIMLITNYFQVRGVTPLQTEVVETLKEINDQNANNPVLQEQIRELDLLARQAYFARMDRLMVGVYILLGMLAVFLICMRLYYADYKHIPAKEIDSVDEWLIKTRARSYVIWGASCLAALALLFVFLSSPHLQSYRTETKPDTVEMIAEVQETEDIPGQEVIVEEVEEEPEVAAEETVAALAEPVATEETVAVETVPEPVVSKVTHNAFRGNNSNGISAAKNLPTRWDLSNGTNIAWKQPVPRHGYNSPVINGNRVFFSGGDEEARELYCYDLTTGEKLWTLAATSIPGSPAQLPKTTEDTGLAASSVATNGKQVCAIFANADIICADMDGKQFWAKNLGVPENHYGYASSLLIYGNQVIVQYDNQNTPKVIALDLSTGAERWSKSRTERVTWSSPMIASAGNNAQLVLMGNPGITAYNPNNGEQLWRVECLSGEVGASACFADGVVFGASEYAKMVAINAADGSVLWESTEFLPEVSSPVATKDNLYVATSYGLVVSYDTQTGELRKEHELDSEFYSSPIIAEGKVYLFSTDGKMHIFSANDDFNLLGSFETGEKTFATPAFTDGKIIVRTENSIYCVIAN